MCRYPIATCFPPIPLLFGVKQQSWLGSNQLENQLPAVLVIDTHGARVNFKVTQYTTKNIPTVHSPRLLKALNNTRTSGV